MQESRTLQAMQAAACSRLAEADVNPSQRWCCWHASSQLQIYASIYLRCNLYIADARLHIHASADIPLRMSMYTIM